MRVSHFRMNASMRAASAMSLLRRLRAPFDRPETADVGHAFLEERGFLPEKSDAFPQAFRALLVETGFPDPFDEVAGALLDAVCGLVLRHAVPGLHHHRGAPDVLKSLDHELGPFGRLQLPVEGIERTGDPLEGSGEVSAFLEFLEDLLFIEPEHHIALTHLIPPGIRGRRSRLGLPPAPPSCRRSLFP